MKKTALLLIGILISQISFGQECLDVQFKIRGYFYAGTSLIDSTALGGYYSAKNAPKKLTTQLSDYIKAKELAIVVKTDLTDEFEKGISGFKVYLINKSDSIVELAAQDSRLNLKRQVFYNNEWKDIEYLPSSWCGNSYHSVYIKPNEYWEFTAPCLTGKIAAKFRFQLFINDNLAINSNEFEGSFNKKQLKKEQGHKPNGLMDPYND